MKKWRSVLNLLFLIGIVTSVSTGSIMAYLSDADKVSNELSVGGNNISVDEEYDSETIEPGERIPKKVRIQNDGPNDCYVRVRALFTDSDVGQYATIDWNTSDWIYNEEDEFYYYRSAVSAGDKTSYLMTYVQFHEDIPEYSAKEVELIIYAESYQADGFSSYTEAWDDYQINIR